MLQGRGGRYPSSGSSGAPSPFIGASTKPTGYRRNLTPNDLMPLEAPTQKRNYMFQSPTSRKELPPSVTRTFHPSPRGEKRSSLQAGLPTRAESEGRDQASSAGSDEGQKPDTGDNGSTDEDTKALKDHVEQKRRANTIAARKSRRRKVEFIEGLQVQIQTVSSERDALRDENQELKEQINQLRLQLQQQVPPPLHYYR